MSTAIDMDLDTMRELRGLGVRARSTAAPLRASPWLEHQVALTQLEVEVLAERRARGFERGQRRTERMFSIDRRQRRPRVFDRQVGLIEIEQHLGMQRLAR